MRAKPLVADLICEARLFQKQGVSVWRATKHDDVAVALITFSPLALPWSRLFETLRQQGVAVALNKDAKGRAVCWVIQPENADDTDEVAAVISRAIASASRKRRDRSRFYADRGWLTNSTVTDSDAFDSAKESLSNVSQHFKNRKIRRRLFLVSLLVATLMLALLKLAPPESSSSSMQVSVESKAKVSNARSQNTTKTISVADIADALSRYRGRFDARFDPDVALDSLVRVNREVTLLKRVSLGGTELVEFRVGGYSRSIEATFELIDGHWTFAGIK